MFCLRSWLPLLFIPTNASPAFIFLFFVCTYFLNRPCVYCSFLLLILFVSSCNWSDRCFFDFSANWFQSRPGPSLPLPSTKTNASEAISLCGAATIAGQGQCCGCGGTGAGIPGVGELLNSIMSNSTINSTIDAAQAAAGLVADQMAVLAARRAEWTGLGIEWLRSLLGRREWRIECMDLTIRL